jgi:fused signal recognition particle receptor
VFDFLKKKISGFIDGLAKKEDEKGPAAQEPKETAPPEMPEAAPPEREEAPEAERPRKARPGGTPRKGEEKAGKRAQQKAKPPPREEEPAPSREMPETVTKAPEPAIPAVKAPPPEEAAPPQAMERRAPQADAPDARHAGPEAPVAMETPAGPVKPKERIRLGIVGAVRSMITREVEITDKDVGGMLDSLELELLEADVDLAVAEGIKAELSQKLVGAKVGSGELHSFVGSSIRETLIDVLTNERAFDIAERAEKAEKPLKVAFLGINGAGKTTTIAKVAKMLQGRNMKVVFAAADTFRAAAIEQMGVHAERLGIKVIKRDYGSDPTSVAYDAVNYARAHGIDAVLIDTAGRQDTNISLINEMKKLDRVIKPDIKIYVGESIAGNAIIEQVSAFNREIGIDAVILTKLDCDPKGGTMLSISKATGIPIIYVGTGQGYDQLEKFDPASIVGRIVE